MMKKYHEFYDEISEKELFKGLLGFGLFAEKIPNFLSSEFFFEYIEKETFPYNDKIPKDYIRYSSMRNINIPRPLAIPEPFSYANQVKILVDNWIKIREHFKNKTKNDKHKVSRIHLRKLKKKNVLFEMNYKNFDEDGVPENKLYINSKYVVNVDIATCFPSIYSHAISWSLVGKEEAKKKSKNCFKEEWFNQIDFYTRNLKYGETNGILIGPHSSNLISEIILCCIDKELIEKGYKFYRNIDDYTCYTSSFADSEKFILDISNILKKYELSLNSKKNKIVKLPQASVVNWVSKLRHFYFKDVYKTKDNKEGIKLKDLKGFLDFVIEIMLENNNDASILKYGIKRVAKKYLSEKAKEYYIDKIHHLTLLYPYLVLVLEEFVFEIHNISLEKIKDISIDLYNLGRNKNNYELCSYAIYFSLKYNLKLESVSEKFKNDAIESEDCIFLMIAYIYDKRNNDKKYLKEYKKLAKELIKNDFERFWLFCYEILSQGELKGEYKKLKLNKISFIKQEFLK